MSRRRAAERLASLLAEALDKTADGLARRADDEPEHAEQEQEVEEEGELAKRFRRFAQEELDGRLSPRAALGAFLAEVREACRPVVEEMEQQRQGQER